MPINKPDKPNNIERAKYNDLSSTYDSLNKSFIDLTDHNKNEKVRNDKLATELSPEPRNALVLLGGSSRGNGLNAFALTSRSICPDGFIPRLPSIHFMILQVLETWILGTQPVPPQVTVGVLKFFR